MVILYADKKLTGNAGKLLNEDCYLINDTG